MSSEIDLAYIRQLDNILAELIDVINCKRKYIEILSCPSEEANDARKLFNAKLEAAEKGLLEPSILEEYLGKSKDNSNDNDNGLEMN